jgi:hypothetical protein
MRRAENPRVGSSILSLTTSPGQRVDVFTTRPHTGRWPRCASPGFHRQQSTASWRTHSRSATNTEPTDHSPPNPNPCIMRVSISCPYELVNPLKNVNSANQAMVSCRILTRPNLSASIPAPHPPIADDTSEAVAMNPASAFDMPPHSDQCWNHERVNHEIKRIDRKAPKSGSQRDSLVLIRFSKPGSRGRMRRAIALRTRTADLA